MSNKGNKAASEIIAKVSSERAEEATRIMREALEAASQNPGFKSAMELRDSSTGSHVQITTWETAKSLEAYQKSRDFQHELEQLEQIASMRPTHKSYEVVSEV